ncbi:YdbH domain-containing protein [Aliidiomarina indica]|uniref:YdbH domain-containing protein n=1 Tax=Aliidiomarina indica TaxID=2749147 RepID=UPI00188EA2E8|nr:YdbH domain-containing protein [Aliidiomarina indica]
MTSRILFPLVVRGLLILVILIVVALLGLYALRAWVFQQLNEVGVQAVEYRIDKVRLTQLQLSDISFDYLTDAGTIPIAAEQLQVKWHWSATRFLPLPALTSAHIYRPNVTLPASLFAAEERADADTLMDMLPAFLHHADWLHPFDQNNRYLDGFSQAHLEHAQLAIAPDNEFSERPSYQFHFSLALLRESASEIQLQIDVPKQDYLPSLQSEHQFTWKKRGASGAQVTSTHQVELGNPSLPFDFRIDLNYQNSTQAPLDTIAFQLDTHLQVNDVTMSVAALSETYPLFADIAQLLHDFPSSENSEFSLHAELTSHIHSPLRQWPQSTQGSLQIMLRDTPIGHFSIQNTLTPVDQHAQLQGQFTVAQESEAHLTLAQLRARWPAIAHLLPERLDDREPHIDEDNIDVPSLLTANWQLDWQQDSASWNGTIHSHTDAPFTIALPDYGCTNASLATTLSLRDNVITQARMDANGQMTDMRIVQQQQPLHWPFSSLNWSLSIANTSALSFPLVASDSLSEASQWQGQLNAGSIETTDAASHLELEMPFQFTLNPTLSENQTDNLNPVQHWIRFEQSDIRLVWRQERIDLDPSLSLESPRLSLSGAIQPRQAGWQLSLNEPLQLSGHVVFAGDETPLLRTPFTFNYRTDSIFWGEQGIESDGRSELALPNLAFDPLLAQTWRWQANTQLQSAPFQFRFERAELSNSHGLRVQHHGRMDEQGWLVDWNMTDIFFLAGNPIVRTWADWPELLQLQRGRMGASGQVSGSFQTSAPAFNLNATLNFMDVVGVYDTTSFGGLNGEVQLQLDNSGVGLLTDNLRVLRINQGIELGPFALRGSYQGTYPQLQAMLIEDNLLPHGELYVDELALGLFGGYARVQNAHFSLVGEAFTIPIELLELDLSQVLTQYPAPDLTGTGRFSGTLPLRVSAHGVSIERGIISAIPPGGVLNYRSERAAALGRSNPAMRILTDAFDHFEYERLDGEVIYQEDGALELVLRLHGQNPQMLGSRPIHLNLRLEENLPALITGLQLSNKVNDIIHQRVQQKFLESLR